MLENRIEVLGSGYARAVRPINSCVHVTAVIEGRDEAGRRIVGAW